MKFTDEQLDEQYGKLIRSAGESSSAAVASIGPQSDPSRQVLAQLVQQNAFLLGIYGELVAARQRKSTE